MSHHDVLSLGERLEVEAALDAAFRPLREVRAELSPLRVRAAVRWGRAADATPATEEAPAALRAPAAPRTPAALRWSGAIARLSELSVAVGMSVMIFAGAFGSALEGADRSTVDPAQEPSTLAARATFLQEERELRAQRQEWLDSLRERLDRVRAAANVPLQDWLDPTVVRPAAVQRLNLPAPRAGGMAARGPY